MKNSCRIPPGFITSDNSFLALARDQLESFDKIKMKNRNMIQMTEVVLCAVIKELVIWKMKGYWN